jgi:hypothetical protein
LKSEEGVSVGGKWPRPQHAMLEGSYLFFFAFFFAGINLHLLSTWKTYQQ